MKTANSVEVREKDLLKHLNDAQALITSTSWKTAPKKTGLPGSYTGDMSFDSEISLTNLIEEIEPDDDLLSDAQLHTLRAIRRGLQMGYHIANQYRKRVGVADFKSAAGLSDAQKTEYNEKMQTASAIMQFVASRYLLWDMQSLSSGNSFVGNITAVPDEIHISTPTMGLKCMLFFLGQHIQQQVDRSDEKLVAVVVAYAQSLQEEILNRQGSFKHLEGFVDVTYQLEGTDFTVSGFDLIDLSQAVSIEFNRQSMDEIKGNRDAKHFARRLVTRMLCYDFVSQRNPFVELGGFMPVFMGYGIPGTGKSMLIAAVATMLHDYCKELGTPFLFHPLPDNIIDSYQGNSAKNMVQWMRPMQDSSKIIFAPIDDAENILEERTRDGVSEGVRAAIGVFLRYTEGAYAINHGNSAIGIFTNLPEQLDKAVISRVQARFAINGARTVHDILDQGHLWWHRIEELEPGFVGMKDPKDYTYQSDQVAVANLGEIADSLDEPTDSSVRALYKKVLKKNNHKEHMFFAELFFAVQQVFPFFSSRDIRNIQSAVDLRLMDFDLPSEWFEDPKVFVEQDYDTKRSMILELRRENMKGLNFAEIQRQESVRYLDNMAGIAGADFNRKVEASVERMRVEGAALKELKSSS